MTQCQRINDGANFPRDTLFWRSWFTLLIVIFGGTARSIGPAWIDFDGETAAMMQPLGLDYLRLVRRFQSRGLRLADVGGKVRQEWIS